RTCVGRSAVLRPRRHCRETGRKIGELDTAVWIAVLVHVHARPFAGLCKNSHVRVFRHATVRLAAACAAFLNHRCCPDREATLVENPLVSVFVDFPGAPRANARYPRVLQVGVDVKSLRASALWPEPAAVNLVLKEMPLSAVIEVDGLLVGARCGNPVVRYELFLAKHAVDQPV